MCALQAANKIQSDGVMVQPQKGFVENFLRLTDRDFASKLKDLNLLFYIGTQLKGLSEDELQHIFAFVSGQETSINPDILRTRIESLCDCGFRCALCVRSSGESGYMQSDALAQHIRIMHKSDENTRDVSHLSWVC